MNNYKLLFLLITCVIFVNFNNYFGNGREKLAQTIALLQTKIAKEKKLDDEKIDKTKFNVGYKTYFFDGTKLSYSQSMGKMQEIINKAVRDACSIKYLKWSQLPITTKSYEKMKMKTTLECSLKGVFVFINALRAEKLFYIENFHILKLRNKEKLSLNLQIVAFRITDDVEK